MLHPSIIWRCILSVCDAKYKKYCVTIMSSGNSRNIHKNLRYICIFVTCLNLLNSIIFVQKWNIFMYIQYIQFHNLKDATKIYKFINHLQFLVNCQNCKFISVLYASYVNIISLLNVGKIFRMNRSIFTTK